jgi:hypothetical protein
MRHRVAIENIEELRLRQGIDDVELREEIRGLRAGAFVKLTLLGRETRFPGETVVVRITSIKGSAFRGKLARDPVAAALAHLHAGSPITFTAAHIHSLAKARANHEL